MGDYYDDEGDAEDSNEEQDQEDDSEEEPQDLKEVELEVYSCLIARGAEEEQIAPLVQVETCAFIAWNKLEKKQTGKGKSKEKGK